MALLDALATLERQLEPEAMESPRAAAVYDRVARAHSFLDELFVRKAAGLGVRSGRALDVGCGSGRLAVLLSRRLPELEVVAVDLSEPMIGLARCYSARQAARRATKHKGNAEAAGAHRVRFVLADAKRLPFAEASFDLVLSQHTLHHLPEPQAMLEEMVRVARPGAPVFVRDLRRPRLAGSVPLLVGTFGHIYDQLGGDAATGKAQYRDSLAAALSLPEWIELATSCGVPAGCVSNVPLINHADILFRKASI